MHLSSLLTLLALLLLPPPPHEYFAVVIDGITCKPIAGVQASVTQLDVSRTVRTEPNGRFTLDVTNDSGLHIRLMAWGYEPVEYDRTPHSSWPDTLTIMPAPPSIHQLPNGY